MNDEVAGSTTRVTRRNAVRRRTTGAAMPTHPAEGAAVDDAFMPSVLPTALSRRPIPAREAREISRTLFDRLAALGRDTAEYHRVRDLLIELNMTLVRFAARRFPARADQREDILQVGTIGLIMAVDRYEPDHGAEFATFAIPTIVGEIKRFFRDTSWSVHVPRRLQELRLDLAKATEALCVELGRSPTIAELARRMGVDEEQVVETQVAANAYTAVSIDASTTANDDETGTLAQWLTLPDDTLEAVVDLTALQPLIAELPPRDRAILAMRFSGDMTQAAIGAELGLSQMHISRLLNAALARLRHRLLDAG
jgi:RNA polymerase sigma-B factor